MQFWELNLTRSLPPQFRLKSKFQSILFPKLNDLTLIQKFLNQFQFIYLFFQSSVE